MTSKRADLQDNGGRGLEIAFWGLGTSLLWCLILLWGHYRNPVGLGCGGSVPWFSCAATLVPVYNQVFGVPWAVLGTGASIIGLVCLSISRARGLVPALLLAGAVPLGYLRGLEFTVIGGICPMCWLVLLSWGVALAVVPGAPRGRFRAVAAIALFGVGIVAGAIASSHYPDPDEEVAAALRGSEWRFVDVRRAEIQPTGPVPVDGLVVVVRAGCPYCHAYVARTLLHLHGGAGTVWMLPRRNPQPVAGLPGEVPGSFPATWWVVDGAVVAERHGFMSLGVLERWVRSHGS